MRHPFATELVRSIRTSLTRFLAIVGIVGLGVGFYAGLRMSGHDMRAAADAFYDGTQLYDLRVVSTLGLTDSQIDAIRRIEGVEQVTGGYAADIMTTLHGEHYAMRIMSCDMDAAKEGVANSTGSAIESDDPAYLNRLVLASGHWPETPNQCVLSADRVMGEPIKVGDVVEVLYGTADLDGVLRYRTFIVSGLVHSSFYPSSVTLGYTNLGSGSIQQYMFVSPEAFCDDLPYTEVFVTVDGARELLSGSDGYQACVDGVAQLIEDRDLGEHRLAQVKADAERELADAQKEYDEGKAEADKELAEAAQKLDDALAELEDAEREISSGERDLQEGIAELANARAEAERQLADARALLESNARKLDDAEAQLGMTQADIDAARAEVEKNRKQLDDAEAQLGMTQADIDAARAEVEKNRKQLDDAEAQLGMTQADIDSARAEVEKNRKQLDDAEAQLGMTQADIDSARAELEAGKRQLDDAEAQLGMTQADIDSARAELEAGEQQLDSAEEQLGMTQADIDAARAEADAAAALWVQQRAGLVTQYDALAAQRAVEEDPAKLAIIDAKMAQITADIDAGDNSIAEASAKLDQAQAVRNQIDSGRKQLKEASAKLDQAQAARTQIDASRAELDESSALLDQAQAARTQIDEGRKQLEEASAQLDQAQAARTQIDEGRKQLEEASAQLDQAQAARTQIDEGRKQLEEASAQLDQAQDARTQIDDGRRQLADGWRTYYEQAANADEQLASAKRTLDDARAQLDDARRQADEGWEEYREGLKTYNDSRAEVESRLADAAAQLEEARKDIDELEVPSVYVLDRTKNVGIACYNDDSQRIDAIAAVFPFIFFLVAALVSLTTMTRMIEDERIDIGTHKALGFSTARITAKYVAYAGLAGIVGSIAGIAILSQILPRVVQVAYAIIYNLPLLPFPIPIDLGISLTASGLGLGVTFLAIFGAAAATLKEVPATLMLPRAPKAGKRILLERVGIIWRNLSFSWKVTCRNLFRYKRRLAMTVIGIAGCTALLLTGLGLHDSIWDIIAYQYENDDAITCFNVTVGMSDDAVDGDMDRIEGVLEEVGGADAFARIDLENMQATSAGYEGTTALQAIIVDDFDSFSALVSLRVRGSKEPVEFGPGSVVVTEKMAKRLGVGVGDQIVLYDQDEIGNATGRGYAFTVTGICENYVYHYVYVGADAWREATGNALAIDSMLVHVEPGDEVRLAISEALDGDDAVATVVFDTETVDAYRKSLSSVNLVVVVLVVAAAALAFIVLYNLINIQLIERTREIASLKVLGFDRREVAAYLFRETVLLVIVGALVGLALGVVMEGFVVVTAEVDAVMFGRDIHLPSFLIAFGMTMVFSLIVMVAIMPKLHRIDMVESLKSVD